jgi:signal peptidase I
MQCSNCQFENMPGITVCGRCGANLRLASLKIDVHPPRASRGAKLWRRWFPLAGYGRRVRHAIFASMRSAGDWTSLRLPELPLGPLLVRMIVPGWVQLYVGRVRRARWMFWSYVGLMLVGTLFMGTSFGLMALGLAVSVHAASITDILCTNLVELRLRIAWAFLTLVLLIVLVYYPVDRLVGQVATAQQFNMASPPFARGDVVLINRLSYRWSEPQPGDVVLYDLPTQDVRMRGGWGGNLVYRLRGARIDRILACGGQHVTTKDGQLLIDDKLSLWSSLNPQKPPDGLDFTVPKDCYFIVSSGDNFVVPRGEQVWSVAPVWQAASLVPRASIDGRVYLQYQPLWRLHRIR